MADKLIALIPGDGIGVEVVAQARRLLEHYRVERGVPITLWDLDLGADRYLRDGTTYPKETAVRIAGEARAVLLGALGDPRVPGLEHARDILFGLRFGLDLYANVRPVKALDDSLVPLRGRTAKDVDCVVFRENTEGIYVGMGGQFKRGTPTSSGTGASSRSPRSTRASRANTSTSTRSASTSSKIRRRSRSSSPATSSATS